jgi:hypothetical protein
MTKCPDRVADGIGLVAGFGVDEGVVVFVCVDDRWGAWVRVGRLDGCSRVCVASGTGEATSGEGPVQPIISVKSIQQTPKAILFFDRQAPTRFMNMGWRVCLVRVVNFSSQITWVFLLDEALGHNDQHTIT